MPLDSLTREYEHTPVMLEEVKEALALKPGSIVVDCTLGGAGHSSEFLRALAPGGTLVGIDQDGVALEVAHSRLNAVAKTLDAAPEILLLRGNFGDLDHLLTSANIPYVDALFMDLGVSSPQIDHIDRGFSFKEDAPLDMRMDQERTTLTAADIVNSYDVNDLTRVLREYGEEKWASRIAQFIVNARKKAPLNRSSELVEVIKAAIPASARRAGGHPAKKTFQALRIEVNGELDVLRSGVTEALNWLAPSGRCGVLTYHSLEDRIVKRAFAQASQGCTCPPDLPVCTCGNKPAVELVTRKPLVASAQEVARNPRARSAKLRVVEKLIGR